MTRHYPVFQPSMLAEVRKKLNNNQTTGEGDKSIQETKKVDTQAFPQGKVRKKMVGKVIVKPFVTNIAPEIKTIEEEKKEVKTVIERRRDKLNEYVDALVNGNAIDQLFIRDDLTENAKEELKALAELAITDKVQKAREELADIENKKEELKEAIEHEALEKVEEAKKELSVIQQTIDSIETMNEEFNEQKQSKLNEIDKLNKEIEILKNNKRVLTESIINDLNLIKNGLINGIESGNEENCDWKWEVKTWTNDIYYRFQNIKLKDFEEFIYSLYKKYADINGCTIEEAEKQFLKLSDGITIAKELLPKMIELFGENCVVSNTNLPGYKDFCATIKTIYLPIYGIAKTDRKKL